MPLKYRHTQKAGIPFYGILAMVIFIGIIAAITGGAPAGILILTAFLVLWALLMMSSLTVTIDDRFLRIRFGPGVFFKKFPLSEITECGPNFRTYIWGWGIRWYFNGWPIISPGLIP